MNSFCLFDVLLEFLVWPMSHLLPWRGEGFISYSSVSQQEAIEAMALLLWSCHDISPVSGYMQVEVMVVVIEGGYVFTCFLFR